MLCGVYSVKMSETLACVDGPSTCLWKMATRMMMVKAIQVVASTLILQAQTPFHWNQRNLERSSTF